MRNFDTFVAGALRIANQDQMMAVLRSHGWNGRHPKIACSYYLDHCDDLDLLLKLRRVALRSRFNLRKIAGLSFSLASPQSYGKFSFDYPHSGYVDLPWMLEHLSSIPYGVLDNLAGLLLGYIDFYHETEGEVVDYDAEADGFTRNYEFGLHYLQHLTLRRIIHDLESVNLYGAQMDLYPDRKCILPGWYLRAEPINNMLQLIRFFRFTGNVLRIDPREFVQYPDLEDAMNICTQQSVQDNPLFDLRTTRKVVGGIEAESDVRKDPISQWMPFVLRISNPLESHIVSNAYDVL